VRCLLQCTGPALPGSGILGGQCSWCATRPRHVRAAFRISRKPTSTMWPLADKSRGVPMGWWDVLSGDCCVISDNGASRLFSLLFQTFNNCNYDLNFSRPIMASWVGWTRYRSPCITSAWKASGSLVSVVGSTNAKCMSSGVSSPSSLLLSGVRAQ
jgi:hypothetical protein